jgi:hypothetical protein
MPVLGIVASQISGHLFAPSGAYDSIATTTLSTATASVTFSSIPSTYTHLQVRLFGRSNRATVASGDWVQFQFNSDTAANYSGHGMVGDGSSASASANANSSTMETVRFAGAASIANGFGAIIVDVLDYTNTSKYKTLRALGGYDDNGAGIVGIYSGSWRNTNAITSITITPGGGTTFNQYSSFALYGIKGA